MKSVRSGIRWLQVDLAYYAIVAKLFSSHEQIRVQGPAIALAPVLVVDNDSVDVEKLVVAVPKPLEVDAVVVVRLFER
jgi:hypothetical protein